MRFVSEAGDTANPFHLPLHINVIFWSGSFGRGGITHPVPGRDTPASLQTLQRTFVFEDWWSSGLSWFNFPSFDETLSVSFSSWCIQLAFIGYWGRVLSEQSRLWWSAYSSGGKFNPQRGRHKKQSDGNECSVENEKTMVWSGVLPEEVTLKLRPGRKELAMWRAGESIPGREGASARPRWDKGGAEKGPERRRGVAQWQERGAQDESDRQLGLWGTSGSWQRRQL